MAACFNGSPLSEEMAACFNGSPLSEEMAACFNGSQLISKMTNGCDGLNAKASAHNSRTSKRGLFSPLVFSTMKNKAALAYRSSISVIELPDSTSEYWKSLVGITSFLRVVDLKVS
jgi:hypothetical protein